LFFKRGSHKLTILLFSAFWVARIIGVSHWLLVLLTFFKTLTDNVGCSWYGDVGFSFLLVQFEMPMSSLS
jgi:hypothetical protein